MWQPRMAVMVSYNKSLNDNLHVLLPPSFLGLALAKFIIVAMHLQYKYWYKFK